MTGGWGEARPAGITRGGGGGGNWGPPSSGLGGCPALSPPPPPPELPAVLSAEFEANSDFRGFGVETDTATPVTAGLKIAGMGGGQTRHDF